MSDIERWLPGMVEQPRLQGARVTLRAMHARDIEPSFELHADPIAMRYWSGPPLTTRAQAEARVQQQMAYFPAREAISWAITLSAHDSFIGNVTLFRIDADNRRCEIGYCLQRAFWGGGYAREALELAIDFAFGPLALARIEADIDPRNERSVALIERVGFQREGLLRERWRVGEEVSDTAFYGLLRQDRPRRPA